MKKLPAEVESYKRTPEFNNDTIPKGLLKAHKTKEGTWGKIVILSGQLHYRILEPQLEEWVLSPRDFGVVEPTVLHEISPIGAVTFYVEFFRNAQILA